MNQFSLAGHHVVVTGAGRGLGRAMSVAIAEAGADVTLVARTESQLRTAQSELMAIGASVDIRCADLLDLASIADLARDLCARPVNGVVHAAGVTHRADAVDFPDEALQRVLCVNLVAPLMLSRELTKIQLASVVSSHVFIGSLGSSIGLPRAVAYTTSKAGVLGAVRTLAAEWAVLGVRVNAISPGYFRTELTEDLLKQPEQLARIESRIPMGRLGRPPELGGAAVYLLSDASSYVTGQQIIVDGGWLGA